jgi:hypothetical protein
MQKRMKSRLPGLARLAAAAEIGAMDANHRRSLSASVLDGALHTSVLAM